MVKASIINRLEITITIIIFLMIICMLSLVGYKFIMRKKEKNTKIFDKITNIISWVVGILFLLFVLLIIVDSTKSLGNNYYLIYMSIMIILAIAYVFSQIKKASAKSNNTIQRMNIMLIIVFLLSFFATFFYFQQNKEVQYVSNENTLNYDGQSSSIHIESNIIFINLKYYDYLANEILTTITVDPNNKYYEVYNNCLIEKDTKRLVLVAKDFEIPEYVIGINNDAFSFCGDLETIIIPKSIIKFSPRTFTNCQKLKNIYYDGTLVDWCNLKFNTYLENPLYFAENLYLKQNNNYENIYEIIIPNEVKKINDFAFAGFDNLKNVIIHNDVTSIGSHAFYKCNNLVSISLPYVGKEAKGEIIYPLGYIFGNTLSNEPMTKQYKVKSGTLIKSAEYYNIPKSLKNVIITGEEIPMCGFYNCNNITSVVINNVKVIGESAFENCINLTELKIPRSVKSIGQNILGGAISLKKLVLSIDALKDYPFGYLFGKTKVENTTEIKQYTYLNEEQVLNTYYIPNSLKEVDIIGKNIYKGFFINVSTLNKINIYTSVLNIEESAFENCLNLESINFSKNIKTIGKNAFKNCINLRQIQLPELLETIKESAFENCLSLSKIELTTSINIIEYNVFNKCENLTIYCSMSEKPLNWHDDWNGSAQVIWNS